MKVKRSFTSRVSVPSTHGKVLDKHSTEDLVRKPVESCSRRRKLRLMSSPKKKSIRETRLEKIEKLLEEEHEKSTSLYPWPPSNSSFPLHITWMSLIEDLCSTSSFHCLLCTLYQEYKMQNVSLTLNRKQASKQRKNKSRFYKYESICTICSASLALYNCETTRSRV